MLWASTARVPTLKRWNLSSRSSWPAVLGNLVAQPAGEIAHEIVDLALEPGKPAGPCQRRLGPLVEPLHHEAVLLIDPIEEADHLGDERIGIIQALHHLGRQRRAEAH